jgi:hypothetical protein
MVPRLVSARLRAQAWTILVQERASPSNPMLAVWEREPQTAPVEAPGPAGHPTQVMSAPPGSRQGQSALPGLQRGQPAFQLL